MIIRVDLFFFLSANIHNNNHTIIAWRLLSRVVMKIDMSIRKKRDCMCNIHVAKIINFCFVYINKLLNVFALAPVEFCTHFLHLLRSFSLLFFIRLFQKSTRSFSTSLPQLFFTLYIHYTYKNMCEFEITLLGKRRWNVHVIQCEKQSLIHSELNILK